MNLIRRTLLAASVLTLTAGAWAQQYPSKPIRMIVPFGAGGPTDAVARAIAEGMGKRLGQTVVVENKAGAGGRIGLEAIATLPPDGYNIGFVAATLPSLEAFYKDWKRDVVTSYSFIGSGLDNPGTYLWGSANLQGKNLAEALAYYKAHPGTLNIAYTAPGVWELMFAHLDQKYGLKATRIAYKSTAEAKMALLSGDVHMLADNYPQHVQDWKAGKEKALAIIAPARVADSPDVPSLTELKVSDHVFDSTSNFGVIGPAGIPADMVAKLNQAVNDLLKDPEFVARFKPFGAPAPRTPEQYRDFIKAQRDQAVKLVKDFKIEQM